ncbi:hypothetical protein [Neisseria sp. Ec49-e6-T10]|uniref:hypothetical protein n=1 Tax=Neisseria sp. Ec49-e6-T10 TaxID=3140744 RepID=UPI003EB840B6
MVFDKADLISKLKLLGEYRTIVKRLTTEGLNALQKLPLLKRLNELRLLLGAAQIAKEPTMTTEEPIQRESEAGVTIPPARFRFCDWLNERTLSIIKRH